MRKEGETELIGKMVMVNSDVAKAGEQKKVGVVLSVIPEKNLVRVDFDDGEYVEYKKQQLLILYPRPVILQGLVSNWEMAGQDCKTILRVIRLMQKKQLSKALLLACCNKTTKFFCTTNCAQWLDMQSEHRKEISNRRRK